MEHILFMQLLFIDYVHVSIKCSNIKCVAMATASPYVCLVTSVLKEVKVFFFPFVFAHVCGHEYLGHKRLSSSLSP